MSGLGTSTRRPFDPADARRTVFEALAQARRDHGAGTVALVDGDERTFTYDDMILASFALGSALKRGTRSGECVGVMLPTGAAAALSFFALSAYGRIPTMLNFTSGLAGLKSALATAQVKRVVTARRLVEVAGLQALVDGLGAEIVYLEDVRKSLSLRNKLAGAAGKFAPRLLAARPDPSKPAAILFTSGTEGEPKGVALSHENILANVAQARAHFDFYSSDVLLNPLPAFHCFGLVVGILLPLMIGVKTVCHPTPLQPKEIVRRIRRHGATILISTDTFIHQYGRVSEPGDLDSLRMAVCGAERLRDETRTFLRKKTGIVLLEGYGVTEASPVVAANQPEANHPGTVGRMLPGIEARLDPVEGIAGGGQLHLRGPNIMLGYIKPDAPGKIVPPEGGWYNTGDIVSIDEDGFIAIRGRLKRFAKIGGEAVSLAVVENIATALWPENAHAAVAVPDGRKGEQIVLVTDAPEARRVDMVGWAQNHGVTELALPRRVVLVESIPSLATGKTDYVSVQKLAELPADSTL
ncbi:MAG TPA: AMP-binding protein [Rhizomicrobium sp.]|jgi:acyl-[acyl-carrier-protein]-phospholipid O-acyltransferase/long-chain-fatty-acid--[acyl-carrier-protein] ligase|nr:AMP-binding protein [Rhizomicrobium sp.]